MNGKRKAFVFLMISILASFVSAQTAKIASIYTSLDSKGCKTLESSVEGTGWYRGECKGIGGYKLQITEGDIRQSIDVIAPNKKKYKLDLTGNVSTAFSYVGAKAEWRVTKKGKIITPIALIVRYNASENQEDPSKNTSYLVISKITKNQICVTDVVNPGANANEEARKLADAAAAKPCKASNN